jgi:hypothetical protein
MVAATKNPISLKVANERIQLSAGDMKCWKVGLIQGSLVYFELGQRVSKPSMRGRGAECGSGYLSLDGYRWSILQNGEHVTSAAEVTRKIAEEVVAAQFIGESLLGIALPPSSDTIEIRFTGGLRVKFEISQDPSFTDTELFSIGFPDKSYVIYSVTDGLYLEINYGDTALN